ncbi:MAG: AbrB/MazE/SpoVT family DNA-binding domain-containing protein [Candidatus Bathyarchaeia archaeon]
MYMRKVKVLQGFRITLPEEARRKLRIEQGDLLEFAIEGAKIVLTSPKIPENPTLKMLGLAAGHPEELEEALIREVEEKLAREKVH